MQTGLRIEELSKRQVSNDLDKGRLVQLTAKQKRGRSEICRREEICVAVERELNWRITNSSEIT